ncbi:MAG: family 43 glycosylhydrolase [Clostridia bacterium]|nr:family 43 glycosylhydrolase [Clostridia bacterium]
MKQVFNPYLPLDEYIPDGEPHVFGDRVYVYGSHDKENGKHFCMLDYVTYSAPVDNLKEWRYEGVIYKASYDPLYPEYKYMFAPDVVRGNDGRYYLYYSLANDYPNCSYIMSVAVCDTPSGNFEFLGHVKYKDGTLLQDGVIFDPGLLNDNGVIRLYYGMWWNFERDFDEAECLERQINTFKKTKEEILSSPDGVMGPFVVELESDMVTVKTPPKRIFPRDFRGTSFEGHEFFEASSMRKINDKYYFIYSTFQGHELAYATSDYPDRDFEFGGVIVSNGDIGYKGRKYNDMVMRIGNNHGSIECINGKWYIFYHRHTTKTELSRQGCAEEIQILENGFIPQVEITSCGLNAGPLLAQGTYPSIICCHLSNGNLTYGCCVDKRLPHIICENGERFIKEIENDTVIGYKYFDFKGNNKIGIKYRSSDIPPLGKLLVMTEENGTPLCFLEVTDSTNWATKATNLELYGKHSLYFKYEGAGSIDILEISFN